MVKKLVGQPSMSPDGRFVAYFDGTNWRLFDTSAKTARVVTGTLKVILTDEEHDTPDAPPAYGLGGWVDQGAGLLVYDRYDIWQIPTAGGEPVNLTGKAGRAAQITFRVVTLDREERSLSSREPLLLTAYHNKEKNWGFYAASFAKPGVEQRVDQKKLFKFIGKAKKADAVLFSREDYGEFPDVWVSDLSFKAPKKMSDANPQIAEFAWGTAELVEYKSRDGVPLQGVLIKPANYVPGQRYPVITYFYERESQLLYAFNEPVVNHRPSFAVYAGAGYAIFLPDVVFTVGHPGQSIAEVPRAGRPEAGGHGRRRPEEAGPARTLVGRLRHGVHGDADQHVRGGGRRRARGEHDERLRRHPLGIGRSRGSSSTRRARAASAGRSGRSATCSSRTRRCSSWTASRRRCSSSTATRTARCRGTRGSSSTSSLRREGKNVILLQYRGEPHHLQKYPNKLDYSIKMKQYFDHYLKGEPAAEWIVNGQPYQGK